MAATTINKEGIPLYQTYLPLPLESIIKLPEENMVMRTTSVPIRRTFVRSIILVCILLASRFLPAGHAHFVILSLSLSLYLSLSFFLSFSYETLD